MPDELPLPQPPDFPSSPVEGVDDPPLTTLEQDIKDAHGWHHYHTSMAHVGSWNSAAVRLDQEKGNPRVKTLRSIRMANAAEQGTDGSLLLRVHESEVASYGAAFQDLIVDGRFTQLFAADYQDLRISPEEAA